MDEKRTVSVLTFWGVPNFGAFAQAYALNRVLREVFPQYDIKHFAYLAPSHHDMYFSNPFPKAKGIRNALSFKYLLSVYHHFCMKRITWKYFIDAWDMIPHLTVTEKEIENRVWDIVVTGSDCIWEYSVSQFGDDRHLIGENVNCKKMIAYACSFGDVNLGDRMPDFVGKGLSNYNAISVRDIMSKAIVQDYLPQKDCPIVLDPTLLYDFPKDKMVQYYQGDRYIFVYGNRFNKKIIKEVRAYAKKHHLKIIAVGQAPRWVDVRIFEMEPFKWIGMFRNAEFVVTSTFHGLMFSLIFRKKIYFFQTEYVKNRSMWILRELGLDKLFLSGDFDLKKMFGYQWDYNEINRILDKYKKESIDYLKKVIVGE